MRAVVGTLFVFGSTTYWLVAALVTLLTASVLWGIERGRSSVPHSEIHHHYYNAPFSDPLRQRGLHRLMTFVFNDFTATTWRVTEDGEQVWRARSATKMVEFISPRNADTVDIYYAGKAALDAAE